jgi:hypothetical protein
MRAVLFLSNTSTSGVLLKGLSFVIEIVRGAENANANYLPCSFWRTSNFLASGEGVDVCYKRERFKQCYWFGLLISSFFKLKTLSVVAASQFLA